MRIWNPSGSLIVSGWLQSCRLHQDKSHVADKRLDQEYLEDPRRAVDQLLRWHFRQAVLANMKGDGIPVFEFDFPPGSDIMDDIGVGPTAAERMEFELFSRLGANP